MATAPAITRASDSREKQGAWLGETKHWCGESRAANSKRLSILVILGAVICVIEG